MRGMGLTMRFPLAFHEWDFSSVRIKLKLRIPMRASHRARKVILETWGVDGRISRYISTKCGLGILCKGWYSWQTEAVPRLLLASFRISTTPHTRFHSCRRWKRRRWIPQSSSRCPARKKLCCRNAGTATAREAQLADFNIFEYINSRMVFWLA